VLPQFRVSLRSLRSLLLASIIIIGATFAWGAAPDYESYDWDDEEINAVVGSHGAITISGDLGSAGNVSGHYYLPISANLKNSDSPWQGYMGIAATSKIDSIEILYCPNGKNNTSIAWVAWGKDITPNQYTLGHGVTTGTTSSKAWDSRIWEKIDLTGIAAYTIYLSRSIREFREIGGSSNLSNFGAGQTINVLGIRVWLKPAASCPTPTASRGGTESGSEVLGTNGFNLTCSATGTDVTYQWKQYPTPGGTPATATNAEGSGATTTSFTPCPAAIGTYIYFCVVTDACGNTATTSYSGAFTFTAPPSHNVTVNVNNASYGSATAASATVVQGRTTTITATPNTGYVFDHWSVSGAGSTLSSIADNPTILTMGTTDATVTAYFVESTCPTHGTVFSLAMKNNGSEKSLTANEEVDLSLTYATISGGSATFTNTGSAKGKITKANPGQIYFDGNAAYVILDFECPIQTGDTIKVTNATSIEMAFTTTATLDATYKTTTSDGIGTFIVPAALNNVSKLYCWRATGNGLKFTAINITRPLSHVAPTSVTVEGTWDRFAGETITLTATPVGGTGTPSYKWQKLLGSTWTDVSNGDNISGATSATLQITSCTKDNSGKYRCIVNMGAVGCETASATATDGSEGFKVKVYTLDCYNGGVTSYNFTRIGDTQAGTLNVNLAANTSYEFEVVGDDEYYGNTSTINEDVTNWEMTSSAGHLHLNSGLGGTFTFTMDYSSGGNNSTIGVPELSVTYPRKAIYVVPNGYTSDNAKLSIYYWRTSGSDNWSDFLTTNACSGGKYVTEIPAWATGFSIVRLKNTATSGNWSDKWNQTEDVATSTSYDQYTVNTWCSGDGCKETVTAGSFSPSTYTISFNAGDGEGSMPNLTGIVCDANQTLPANAYVRSNHVFIGWHANVATTIGGNAVAAGTLIADGATLQHITTNITLTAQWMQTFNFSNGNFHDWGTCVGGNLTLSGSLSGVSYQLYKDGVASGEPKAGTGSSLQWHVIADGVYMVKSVANATYPEATMPGTADVQLQDPTISGPTTVSVGSTITLEHSGYHIAGTNWVSSNTSVATVSTSGVVTGVSEGTVTITFHGVGGYNEDGSQVMTCDGTFVITVESNEDCEIIASAAANTTSTFSASVGSVESHYLVAGSSFSIDGFSCAVELENDDANERWGNIVLSPKAGKTFEARDSLIVVVYNPTASTATIGFVINNDVYEASCASHQLHYFRQLLTEANLTYGEGNVQIEHHEDSHIAAAWVKHCEVAGGCTEYIWKASDATQVGSGSPYLYEVTGVGAAMKNATGGSALSFDDMSPACGSSNKKFTTGSSKFAFKTYNTITGMTIYGSGTGSNRTLSGCRVGSTTSNYASVVASTDDSFETSGECDQMYIVFENEIAANSYIEITFSGNVNISAIKTEYCTTCDGTRLVPSSASETYTIGGSFTEPTFELQKTDGTLISTTPILTFSSSNTSIATVNTTTGEVSFTGGIGSTIITAIYHGDATYCEASASYTITVVCAGGESAPKIVADPGTALDGCNSSITLYARQQDGSAFVGGTYQWYRDGEAIDEDGNDFYYVVRRSGTYTVVRTGNCTQASTNSAVVTNEQPEPTVERLVPFQYYHVNKTYTTKMKMRHLFAVKSIGTYNGKSYSMTATRNGVALDLTSGYDDVFMLIEGSGSDPDTVMIDLNELNGKFSAGDEIEFTCSAVNCNAISPVNEDITMYVIDAKPTLAYICSGADGAGTRNKKNFKYNGDFLTGYNKADLCLQDGTTSFDAETELPFYTYIKTRYRVTPVNGYAPFRKLDYEPFDLLLLTDYPKATINDLTRNKFDSMYVLVDYRPMLSFKTHMVAKTPSSWAAKGFTTEPVVPKAKPQTAMNIVCYSHPMFNALSIGSDGVYRDNDDLDQVVYQMLSDGGYDKNKGIQGFEIGDAGNFVTIAFTHYDAKIGTPSDNAVSWNAESDDRKLVASCERQANIEARMILISVNADALCKMTTAGMVVVDSALQYLLITDPEKLADCSLIFNDNHGTGVWSDKLNWGPRYNQLPNADLGAHVIRPCTVDIPNAVSLNIKLEQTGKITIPVGSALNVGSTIRRHNSATRTQMPTNAEDISIAANASGNGTLILSNPAGDTKASVQLYSKAQTDGSNTVANWKWQYIGTPFNDVSDAMNCYYESWLYSWSGSGWTVVPRGGALTPFIGYCITHPEANHTYNMTGTLATTATQNISVPANGYMVVGNSWTAPIQIENFENDDFENIADKSVYFFNTGSDPNGTGGVTEEATGDARWASATYVSVPIHSAPYTGDATISSMQGFYVNTVGGSAGTLHLDYNKLVRPKSGQSAISGPMHVRSRVAAVGDEPIVAKFFVCGTNYDDRLVILEREDFTRTYDSGWDGEKWEGNAISPMIYALNEKGGQEAVTATPDMEGTLIGFRAGEDDEYTFRFNYDGMAEPIYLLDTDTKVYTRVLTGNTYTFSTTDKAAHNRFILTRTEGQQTPTGWSNFTGEEDKVVKFINNGKLFIFVHGVLYDAVGKVVR
jgi:hypothetical protein